MKSRKKTSLPLISFKGRINFQEMKRLGHKLVFALASWLLLLAIRILFTSSDFFKKSDNQETIETLLTVIHFSHFFYIITIALSIVERRLHDTDNSLKPLLRPFLTLLLSLVLYMLGCFLGMPDYLRTIPATSVALNFFLQLFNKNLNFRLKFLFQEGDPKHNQYGPPRKVSKKGKKKKKGNPFRFTWKFK